MLFLCQVLDFEGIINKFLAVKNDILKKYDPTCQFFMKKDKKICFFREIVKKREGEDDGGDDGGRIFPEHPSPILHAPRDNISRKGKSLTPIIEEYIYIYIYQLDP